MPPRWAETTEHCGCTPVGADPCEGAQPDGWFTTPSGKRAQGARMAERPDCDPATDEEGAVAWDRRSPDFLFGTAAKLSATGPSGLRRGMGPGKNVER
ncbi:hypothetical protein NDU88_004257 [Pleurodeles waltl]|uniref:Uncharacterized protein n=1 Tax=Pleurodeles waltl TaxID=8319 RepID=A0AAV7WV12_PLEWA|nr:hypothetical protein NDU88_004257 [Pleurodeles waltl]